MELVIGLLVVLFIPVAFLVLAYLLCLFILLGRRPAVFLLSSTIKVRSYEMFCK
jgi:hypothetical protein